MDEETIIPNMKKRKKLYDEIEEDEKENDP
jgi:hypothetical protein